MNDNEFDFSVLRSFTDVETWASNHTLDRKRFFKALHAIVWKADFAPEKLGRWLIAEKGEEHAEVITRLVADARAVKDYIWSAGIELKGWHVVRMGD